MKRRLLMIGVTGALVVGMLGAALAAITDFGLFRDGQLRAKSSDLFGVTGLAPVLNSSITSANPAAATLDPRKLATFAKSLHVRVVSKGVTAPNVDMMVLWPDDTDPTHLIFCNEQGVADPGVQRLDLATGEVDTILTGTVSCDPLHATPWGSIVFGEEAGGGASGGRMYELIHPLNTTNVLLDRATGQFTNGAGGEGAGNIVARGALGRLSFEGIGLLPTGVAYYGDENRPNVGNAGGSYFKFIPTALRAPGAGPITDLSQSPLTAGSVYGLRVGKRNNNTDYGWGTETGLGIWVLMGTAPDADLRALAATAKLTAYYRPEDLAFDGAQYDAGNVKFCGNNTGNEASGHTWGTTICVTDGTFAQAGANTATPEVQLFVVGNPQLAMMDNIAYQPGRGNWVIHEDGDNTATGRNNDLWLCLPDRADVDQQADGCIRIATLNDLGPSGAPNAGEGVEWTGGVFDSTGQRFFVSVQHNMTGHGVILEITGWE
ncbi:MAG: PhoX family protein [Actinomycetota bacterium]|nr:PhoX family protein [Actinomycetota bacterium]